MKHLPPSILCLLSIPASILVFSAAWPNEGFSVSAAVLTTAMFCLLAMSKFHGGLVSPGGITIFAVAIFYGCGGYAWSTIFETPLTYPQLLQATADVVMFSVLFTLGYVGGNIPQHSAVVEIGSVPGAAKNEPLGLSSVMFWAAISAVMLLLLVILFGGPSQLLQNYEAVRLQIFRGGGLYLGIAVTVTAAACATNWFMSLRERRHRLVSTISLILSIATAALFSRFTLFYALGAMAIAFYYTAGRRARTKLIGAGVVFSVLFLAIGIGRWVTENNSNSFKNEADIGGLIGTILLSQFDHFDTLAILESRRSDWTAQWGATIVEPLPFKLIPRTIAPDKPDSTSIWFMSTFYAGWADSDRRFNRAVGLIAELYINFLPLGLTIAAWALGLACARIWRKLTLRSFALRPVYAAWFSMSMLFIVRNDTVTNVPWILAFGTGIVLADWPATLLRRLEAKLVARQPWFGRVETP